MYKLRPVSLYIHIPWCLKKCKYCDFNSYEKKNVLPEKKYIQHLIQDFEQDMKFIKNRVINTIFIGGGTPSLFKHSHIKYLIQEIKKRILVSNTAEISIEANPHTIECQSFNHYYKYGINRLSLGIQTFNNIILKKIGRTYHTQEANNAINTAKKIYSNLNLDIMYGLPEQSLEEALHDLNKVIEYGPSHISWYQMTIEPNTIFYKNRPLLPNEEIIFEMFHQGHKLLTKSGYTRYEISSYSKNNYQCKHNLNYWNFGDYIGIGCGAHGKITQNNGNIIRIVKNKNPYNFMHEKYIDSITKISKKDIPFEYFMNVFRLYKSISKKHFQEKTKIQEQFIQNDIKKAVQKGYLTNKLNYWYVTKKGKYFLNSLLKIFLH